MSNVDCLVEKLPKNLKVLLRITGCGIWKYLVLFSDMPSHNNSVKHMIHVIVFRRWFTMILQYCPHQTRLLYSESWMIDKMTQPDSFSIGLPGGFTTTSLVLPSMSPKWSAEGLLAGVLVIRRTQSGSLSLHLGCIPIKWSCLVWEMLWYSVFCGGWVGWLQGLLR